MLSILLQFLLNIYLIRTINNTSILYQSISYIFVENLRI